MSHQPFVIYRRPRKNSQPLRFSLIISLLFTIGLITPVSPVYPAHSSHSHILAVYSVSGTAFDDYNQNGTQDSREPGLNGVVATAYNSANAVVSTATTATNNTTLGQYAISIPDGTGPVRIQFSNFGTNSSSAQLKLFQPGNHAGGTTVAFVDGTQATNTVNLGLEIPGEYCQNNPNVATNCYIKGDQTIASNHVIVRFPYDGSSAPTPLANSPDVGTTWGLAYRRSTDTLFASAYLKRHSAFKPGGSTGAIYAIRNANTASPTVDSTPFVDLNALFGAGTAGNDPHDATNNYQVDGTAYDQVGKVSLGGIALSDDETTLYAVNLADKQLYSIPVGAPPAQPTSPSVDAVTRSAIPVPSDCPSSDFRPFAVSSYRGNVYVGAVCSAESTVSLTSLLGDASKLQAYVFLYTPGSGFTTNPIFQIPLNYTRHCANDVNYSQCAAAGPTNLLTGEPAAWNPWHTGFIDYRDAAYNANQNAVVYPQPMLSSIAFDNGDIILGLRDRYGDQMGNNAPDPSGLNSYRGVTAGDTLRACLNTPGDYSSGWTLESNASCGGVQTDGNDSGQGPGTGTYGATSGNGEYYHHDDFSPYHEETSLGGLLQVPGFSDIMSTVFDPTTHVNTGGTRAWNNTTGATTQAYQIYDLSSVPLAFSKSNGLGSLAAFCQSAPIEIGNRVWNDLNGNGIQDPGEPPLAGVTVNIYAADGTTLVATTTTNSTGEYYFTINPYTSYVIKLDNAPDYTGSGPLKNFQLTTANHDSSTNSSDSKAVLPTPGSAIGTGNYPQIAVSAHTPGQNDYNQDVGFAPLPDLSLTKTNVGGTSFYEGQPISYTLTAHSSASAGPILAGHPITVTDTLPAGLNDVSISASGWQISVAPALNHVQRLSRSPHALSLYAQRGRTSRIIHPGAATRKYLPDTTRPPGNRSHLIHPTTVKGKHGLHASLFRLGSIASPLTITATYNGGYPVAQGIDLPLITITGTFNSSAVSSLVNNASVSTPGDIDPTNNTATNTVSVALAPDLAIQISHQGSGCVPIGQSVSYTLAVSNGPSAGQVPTGQTITVTNTLPAGLSNVSIDGGTDWTITPNGTTFTATYKGTLPIAPNTPLTPITISGTVNSSAASSQMQDSATVKTALDINSANDAASDSMPICAAPDLSIVKTQSGNNPFHIGQQVSFSLAVSNGASAGPIIAGQPITVSDTLPTGLSNVGADGGSDWTINLTSTTLTATYKGDYPIATDAKLTPITLTGTLLDTAVPSLANTATVSTPLDSNTSNNSSTDILTVDRLPDLGISLSHQGENCTKVGDTATYTMQVTNANNAGPVPVGEAITVSNTLPSELTNISYNGGSDWDISLNGSTLTATYKGTLPVPAGTALSPISISGTLANPSTLSVSNTATVSTPLDTNSANDTSSDILDVCHPDLTVDISHAGGDTFQVGESVTYTITSHNLPTAGPVVAGQPIALSVTLPPGLSSITNKGTDWQITTATSSSGTTLTAVYMGSYPVLSGAKFPDITIKGTLTGDTVPSYTATAVVKTPQDTNASNDTATDIITVLPLPDLSVALSHEGSSCFKIGQQVTYTMIVSNADTAGPLGANQPVTVTNTLSTGLSDLKVTANGGDWLVSTNGPAITATYIGSYPIAAGASLSPITITGTLNTQVTPQMDDTATVSTPQDINTANDQATNRVTMCPPDLSITKTNTGGNTLLEGQKVTYTLRVSNGAEAGAVLNGGTITVTDILPVGLTDVSIPSTTDWTITSAPSSAATTITAAYHGSYPVSAGATLEEIIISGTLSKQAIPSLVNSATVSTPRDGNPDNDTAINTITVLPLPDLSVTLDHQGSDCFKPGDSATYTITVKNGDNAGTVQPGDFITVTNYIPGGLESVVMHGGTDWDITQDGTKLVATYKGLYPVPAGTTLQPITMTGIITAAPGGRVDNTVRVDTPHEGSPDDNVNGDTMYLCDFPIPIPTPAKASALIFSKTHLGGDTFNVGDSITYVMTVRNGTGAGPVPGGMPIVVTDNVPAGLSDVTADGGTDWQITITHKKKGTVVKANYIGFYPIEPGTTLTEIRVTGIINEQAVGGFVNGASVNAPGDSNAGNKKDTSTITVKPKSMPGQGSGQPGAPGGGPGEAPGLPPTGSDPLAPAPER